MKRSDRLTEILFVVVALAIAALIVLRAVDHASRNMSAWAHEHGRQTETQR